MKQATIRQAPDATPRPTSERSAAPRGAVRQRASSARNPRSLWPPRYGIGAVDERAVASRAGKAMPAGVRAKMEGALGVDFSAVRIHEGPEAEAVGALACTQGTAIHFAPGQYQPESQRGQELLGHELTHVVQQARGRVQAARQVNGVGLNDDPGLEREADDRGREAARGSTHARLQDVAPSPVVRSPTPPAQPATTVQRRVNPEIDAQSAEAQRAGDDALKEIYDRAWKYLWKSASARRIYQALDRAEDTITIKVGAAKNTGAGTEVSWNPWETNVVTNVTDVGLQANPQVGSGHVLGTTSGATMLVHEMGHVKQDLEARAFAGRQGAAGFVLGSRVTDMQSLLDSINNKATLLCRLCGATGVGLPREPMELDNLTRHERPVAKERGEVRRADYFMAVEPGHLQPGKLKTRLIDRPLRSRVTKPITTWRGLWSKMRGQTLNEWTVRSWMRAVHEFITNLQPPPGSAPWKVDQVADEKGPLLQVLTAAMEHWDPAQDQGEVEPDPPTFDSPILGVASHPHHRF